MFGTIYVYFDSLMNNKYMIFYVKGEGKKEKIYYKTKCDYDNSYYFK